MSNTVLLDNVNHHDLRVRTGFSAKYGDAVNLAMVLPTELPFVQREYPVVFRKDESDEFQAIALLGFDKGENLFLDGNGWNARYVPAVLSRGPFLIGLHREAESDTPKPMVHVDLDHPRVSRSEGEPVFLRHGGNSPYLERVNRTLQMILHGTEMQKPMFDAFEQAQLIEQMEARVNLDEHTQYTLPAFYTINADKLAALTGDELEGLSRAGFLSLAYMVANSLGNLDWLIELKNRKRAAQGH